MAVHNQAGAIRYWAMSQGFFYWLPGYATTNLPEANMGLANEYNVEACMNSPSPRRAAP